MNDFVIHEMIQGSQEWLAFKEGKIGSSDAAAIIGSSSFEGRIEAWKRFLYGDPREVTFSMKRGTELEPVAREWINNKLGRNYQPTVLQNVNEPNLIASLDGFYIDDQEKCNILEIKCPGRKDHETALAGYIPEHYFPQLQHQMLVSGSDLVLYLSFYGGEGHLVPCHRDEEYIKELLAAEKSFLSSVALQEKPEPSKKDWMIISDVGINFKACEYQDLENKIKLLQDESEKIRKEIEKDLSHDCCIIGSLKARRIPRKGAIDYGKIEALKGINLDAYRKPSTEYWRFT